MLRVKMKRITRTFVATSPNYASSDQSSFFPHIVFLFHIQSSFHPILIHSLNLFIYDTCQSLPEMYFPQEGLESLGDCILGLDLDLDPASPCSPTEGLIVTEVASWTKRSFWGPVKRSPVSELVGRGPGAALRHI